jgi:hypothetical protein
MHFIRWLFGVSWIHSHADDILNSFSTEIKTVDIWNTFSTKTKNWG